MLGRLTAFFAFCQTKAIPSAFAVLCLSTLCLHPEASFGEGGEGDSDSAGSVLNLRGQSFDAASEFPNLFVPPELRGKNLEELTPAERAVLQARRQKVEAALVSILERSTVPLLEPATGKPKQVRFFERMRQEIRKVEAHLEVQAATAGNPQSYRAQLVPSGGVVRSAYGYLYNLLYEAERRGGNADAALDEVLADTRDIPGYRLRGVGSDFDILLKDLRDPPHYHAIATHVRQLVHEVEEAYKLTHSLRQEQGLKRSLLTIVDVKPLETIGEGDEKVEGQVARSVRGGGIDIDWLYLDMQLKRLVEPSTMVDPEARGNIVDRMILGTYSYLNGQPEEAGKQTVRGMRPRFELPFLRLDNNGTRNLERDLRALLKEIKEKKESNPENFRVDENVLNQVEKTLRNARYGLAHNRIYRNPGRRDEVDGLILELVTTMGTPREGVRGSEEPLLPPYADSFPLHADRVREGRKLPESYFLSTEEFKKSFLPDGVLYHGTPTLAAALSILRGGLRESFYRTGVARGAFSSPHAAFSLNYTGENGTILRLRIRDDVQVRVLDTRKIPEQDLTRLEAEASRLGIETSDLLAREYGADFLILNENEVLIKNTDALKDSGLVDLVDAYRSLAINPRLEPFKRLASYMALQRLVPLAQDLESGKAQAMPEAASFVNEVLKGSRNKPAEVLDWHLKIRGTGLEEMWEQVPLLKEYLDQAIQTKIRRIEAAAAKEDWVATAKLLAQYGSFTARLPKHLVSPETLAARLVEQAANPEKLLEQFSKFSSHYQGHDAMPRLEIVLDARGRYRMSKVTGPMSQRFDDLLLRLQDRSDKPLELSKLDQAFLSWVLEKSSWEGTFFLRAMFNGSRKNWPLVESLVHRPTKALAGNILHFVSKENSGVSDSGDLGMKVGRRVKREADAFLRAHPNFSRALVAEEGKSRPADFYWMRRDETLLPYLDLRQPEDQRLLREYLANADGRHDLSHQLVPLAEQDPEAFFRVLSDDYRIPLYRLIKERGESQTLPKYVSKLLAPYYRDPKLALTEDARSMLRRLIYSPGNDAQRLEYLVPLLKKHPEARALFIELATAADAPWETHEALARLFHSVRGQDTRGPYLDGLKQIAGELDAHLTNHPDVRKRLFERLLLSIDHIAPVLPWNLNLETDRDLLRGAFSKAEEKKRAFLVSYRRRGRGSMEGFNFDHVSGANEDVDSEFGRALVAHRLATSLELRDRILELDPQFAVREARAELPDHSSSFAEGDKEIYFWEVMKRWNEIGWDAIPTSAQTHFSLEAQGPLRRQLGESLGHMLSAGPVSAEWAMRRYLQFQPNDSLVERLAILPKILKAKREYKEHFDRAFPNLTEADLKAELRGQMRRVFLRSSPAKLLAEGDWDRSKYESFPWSLHDPQDVALAKDILKKYPRSEREVNHELSQIESALEKERVRLHPYGYLRSDRLHYNEVPTLALQKRLERLDAEREISGRIPAMLGWMLEDDPIEFVRTFGDVKQISLPSMGFSTDGKTYFVNAWCLPLAQSLNNTAKPLTEEELQFIRYLARDGNIDDIAGMLMYPKVREPLLGILAKERFYMFEKLLNIADDRGYGSWRATTLKVNPEVVQKFEETVIKIVSRAVKKNGWTDAIVHHLLERSYSEPKSLRGLQLRISNPEHQELVTRLYKNFDNARTYAKAVLLELSEAPDSRWTGEEDLLTLDRTELAAGNEKEKDLARRLSKLYQPIQLELANLLSHWEERYAPTMRRLAERSGVSVSDEKCGLSLRSLAARQRKN